MSLYYELAQELVTAIEAHPFFDGSDDRKMEAVFEEDASFLKEIELKCNRSSGSSVSIAFEGSRNLAGKTTSYKERDVRFSVTIWTLRRLRDGDRPAYQLVEALEELLDGMASAAATLHAHCDNTWEWVDSDTVPDPHFSRWELQLRIRTYNPVS